MNVLTDLGAMAPLLVTGIAAFVVLLLTVAGGAKRPAPEGAAHLAFVALAGLAVAGLLLWRHEGTQLAFSGAIIVDGVGVVFGITAILGGMLAVMLSTSYLQEHGLSAGEFLALILLSVVGMLILAMAGDLMTFFIGIETMSLAVYVLAGYRRASRQSQEAALKYFVYGAFASAFVLFGIALLYGEVGRVLPVTTEAGQLVYHPSVAFSALGKTFATGTVSTLGWVAVALVLAGLGFKIAAVPFHMWAPDVYEGAPTPATGFMAVGVKAAAFAGLLRFVGSTLLAGRVASATYVQVFEVLAILTMVIGNLLAIRQTQIKRMLAYSSIAHAGYVLVGVTALIADPRSPALEAIGYYLLGYTVMTLGAFGVVLAFERKDDRRQDLAIDRLAGAAHRYPALGVAMALFMFSLAGIPPTAGFFGKLSLFGAAIQSGRVSLVIIAVLASAVGAYYYLRVLVVMYMRANSTDEQRVRSVWLTAGLWACAALTLVTGVLPETYFAFARRLLATFLG
jgi:NADH-quinone oxidoreductase subunit N